MAVFKQRRGTAAALAAANEVPAAGQIIYETDTNRLKVGNGVTAYASLPYLDSDVTIAEVTGLQAALDGKQVAGSYAALVHTHLKSDVGLNNVDNTSDANKPVSTAQAADATTKANAAQAFSIQRSNHTGTQAISTVVGLQTALDGKSASGHVHTIANVTGLQTALDGKQAAGSYAAAVHTHTIADTTGLQAALDGKQASGSYAAAAHVHAIADTTGLQAALDSKQAAGTYATLVGGTVPAGQLPSYVDDILEYATTGSFPATGETGKIYVTTGDNRTYRWSGSTYIEISASPGSTDAVPEGSTNLYFTNVRAAAAAPVQSVAGRTGAIALAVADVSGAVSSSDSRLTDTRTPTDASVTTAKLSPSLVVDGNSLTLRFRRNTLANFTSANPTAALGELLYETDTNRVKVGDGTTAYTALAYLTTGGGGGGGGASPPSTLLDALTFNGSTTSFTLRSGGTAVTPTAVGNVIVSLNGVIQQPGVSYTIAGSGITFSVAPASTDEFFGVLIGGNVPHKSTHATGGADALTPADIGAASLPATGLTITKTGDWVPQSPVQVFNLVPAQGFQSGNTYTRYTGKWIAGWTYSESSWITGQNRITALTFGDLEGVGSSFNPHTMAALTALSLPALTYIGSSFNPNTMTALTALSLPALTYVGSSFNPHTMAALTTLSAPNLATVGSNFNPNTMAALTTLSAPNLATVGGSFNPHTMTALTTLSLSALTYIGSSFNPNTMTALTTLSAPNLDTVGGSFNPHTMAALTTLSAPNLATVGSSFNPNTMAALANVTLPTNGTLKFIGGDVTMTGMALTVASVDNILQALASLDGTNGTTSYGSPRAVNISGGTTAAPSNLGSTTTAGSQFVCAGTTCTVNWTGHGYANNDVLRISGITTATNANRYARITVVNANQFTYTITSQTATGAGTATVLKAGASANALVTRGVTLTTN